MRTSNPKPDHAKHLTEAQQQQLTGQCRAEAGHADDRHGATDWMMVHLGLGAGLTVAEMTNLRVSDCRVLGSVPSVHVRCGKGGTEGDVAIREDLATHIRQFAALKAEWGHDISADAFLLTAGNGKPYTRSALQKRFKAIAAAAGLSGVSIKCLRHTFCREILRRTGNLKLVQMQARHVRLASAVTYADIWDENGLEMMERMA